MRTLLRWVAITLLCISAHATEDPEAIYDADPEHLWNRIYRASAIRTENGTLYGIDNAVPFDDEFDDPKLLAAVLDEFVEGDGEKQASGELGRALFQHDVWAAFDLAARGERNDLARKLASVVGRLRMQDRSIAALPDNYAEAVKSGGFADDFDAMQPEVAFLPPDLFEPNGPWVEVGEVGQGLVAPVHVQSLSGRSAFRVFIRTPGGRSATLAYLQLTGRDPAHVARVEAYARAQGLFRVDDAPEPLYSSVIPLDLGSVEPCLAGPRRPQDRLPLGEAKRGLRQSSPPSRPAPPCGSGPPARTAGRRAFPSWLASTRRPSWTTTATGGSCRTSSARSPVSLPP